ncbi:cytochrome P450 [Candidatus Poriferisocius sp.]|uniref:cytochrome P450 n=1 Tax=Candidatus Poriferisocius sp. TaxID=3101276 RepID=UPI003B0154F4
MTDAAPDSHYTLERPEEAVDPQSIYRDLRDNTPVVQLSGRSTTGTLTISRHEDVMRALRTPELFSSDSSAVQIGNTRPLVPLQVDPPHHSKHRKALDPLFAPKQMVKYEPRVRELIRELIDDVADNGHCNFHNDIAEPLPSTIFVELLGLPVSRVNEFLALKDGIIRPPARSLEERYEMVKATGQKIYAVLEEVVEARMEERQDDFLSTIIDAKVDGQPLSRDDVVDIGYLFFLAGLDTVSASLDCIVAYLAQNPDHRQRVADDPAIIPHAIEELLRYESPVPIVPRITTADTEMSGCPIAEGSRITVLLGSANTDERVWDNPDQVDFDRESNKHLGFGGGVHRCLGSHLARMELRVALEEWHARVPDYRLADGLELRYSPGIRQVDNLELVW